MNKRKEALERRQERLEASLEKEKKRVIRICKNIPWEAGMRRTRCTPSFRKEDEIISKIKEIKDAITELDKLLEMNIKLVDNTHGYRDYDIHDNLLKRCCPLFSLNKDDMFNVYYEIVENGETHRIKTGAFYDGVSLESTLVKTKEIIQKEIINQK